MGYKRLIRDIESGKINLENMLLAKVALQVEQELNNPQSLMKEPHKKMIMHTLNYARKAVKQEARAIAESDGTFYKDIMSEHAMMIIEAITANVDCCDKALKLIELFVNNLMTVEEIEMILY